jgi:hypothetical protein
MDAAASAIAIVEVSVTITWSCMQYAIDVARASEEIAELCKKIGNLQIILVRLQTQTRAGELLAQLQPALKACNDDLLKLKQKLEPQDGWRAVGRSLVWPFRKRGEFKAAATRIEHHCALFNTAMISDTLALADEIRSGYAIVSSNYAKGYSGTTFESLTIFKEVNI